VQVHRRRRVPEFHTTGGTANLYVLGFLGDDGFPE
jgi:hypothetical protein